MRCALVEPHVALTTAPASTKEGFRTSSPCSKGRPLGETYSYDMDQHIHALVVSATTGILRP